MYVYSGKINYDKNVSCLKNAESGRKAESTVGDLGSRVFFIYFFFSFSLCLSLSFSRGKRRRAVDRLV